MSKSQRIVDRFPRFYKGWEKSSVIAVLVKAMSTELDKTEDVITNLMSAHWVDTAEKTDLDKIGAIVGIKRGVDEDDEQLRAHLKKAVDEYKGGGTISAILKEFQGVLRDDEIAVTENPEADSFAEFAVMANDTWTLGSNSVEDEQSSLSLTVEGEGSVTNPRITNLDTGQFIVFKGDLNTGEQLIIKQDGALLGERNVSEKVVPLRLLRLPRKDSLWKYSEDLLGGIGVFDSGKFDEHTFAVGVPTVRVRYECIRRQPATFLLNIKQKALSRGGLTINYVEEKINYLKAAGINAIVKVME